MTLCGVARHCLEPALTQFCGVARHFACVTSDLRMADPATLFPVTTPTLSLCLTSLLPSLFQLVELKSDTTIEWVWSLERAGKRVDETHSPHK